MTTAEMRSAVERVKKKEGRHTPRSVGKPIRRSATTALSSYEEGVQIAKSAVEQYRKALSKIK